MQAPDFMLPDQNGTMVRLSDFRGQKVIVYFYPKDQTPGCTKEACAFGTSYPRYESLGIPVIGISKDSVASHKKICGEVQSSVYTGIRYGTGSNPVL